LIHTNEVITEKMDETNQF